MKKMLKKSLIGSFVIATLLVPTTSAFATDVPSGATPVHEECNSERIPIYGPWCHGYRMIIGYKYVCTIHNH